MYFLDRYFICEIIRHSVQGEKLCNTHYKLYSLRHNSDLNSIAHWVNFQDSSMVLWAVWLIVFVLCRVPTAAEPGMNHCPLCHNNISTGEDSWKTHLMGKDGCKANPRRLQSLNKGSIHTHTHCSRGTRVLPRKLLVNYNMLELSTWGAMITE